jgi:hypothetical protein
MAKRETKAGRPKKRKPTHYKRETNKERAVRECERRGEFEAAKSFAEKIREGMEKQREGMEKMPNIMENEVELPTELLPTEDDAYSWIILCQPRRNIPRLLRLIADFLDGKPPDNPDNNWFCRAVGAAYGRACSRMPRVASPSDADELLSDPGVSDYRDGVIVALPSFSGFISTLPSFSEFLEIFRKQNPKLKVGERVLRRTLSRLGYSTRTDKVGRPKKK